MTFRVPRFINKWRPPGYGPSNRKRRNLRTNSRHEAFLGMLNGAAPPSGDAQPRNRISIPYFEKQPILERGLQFVPADLEGLRISPYAAKAGDFTEVCPIV